MEKAKDDVFIEILDSLGVLQWLQKQTGLRAEEVAQQAESDFDGLLGMLQEAALCES